MTLFAKNLLLTLKVGEIHYIGGETVITCTGYSASHRQNHQESPVFSKEEKICDKMVCYTLYF